MPTTQDSLWLDFRPIDRLVIVLRQLLTGRRDFMNNRLSDVETSSWLRRLRIFSFRRGVGTDLGRRTRDNNTYSFSCFPFFKMTSRQRYRSQVIRNNLLREINSWRHPIEKKIYNVLASFHYKDFSQKLWCSNEVLNWWRHCRWQNTVLDCHHEWWRN